MGSLIDPKRVIYLGLLRSLFEIKFVEHEQPFYNEESVYQLSVTLPSGGRGSRY